MSYTALYRKWRPDSFDDVKGQDHVVKTLKNQIASNRIGHAYLFCGTRGTGKTSIAKIFAKAVNCEHPIDGSPCGECAGCKSITAGTSMNVIEIDAASNNGVDNIRQIRDEVAYSPTEGKYKVYIIDEVHMLSIGAFNALLKTLEEPPSYVIFILATTEVHKIPITILSRCQRYDFKRITIDVITDRLRELMEKEQIEVEEKALRFIAKTADGSLRDALSLLDQCTAFYFGEVLTYDKALDALGAVDTEVFSRFLRLVLDTDVTGAIHLLEEIIIQGRELTQFVTDFTWYLRNLLLVKTSEHADEVVDVSKDNLERLKEEAQMIDPETLMRYIRIFSELSNQLRYASQKRVMIEMAVIRLCKPSMETDMDSLIERIRQMEEKLEKGVVVSQTAIPPSQSGQQTSTSVTKPQLPKAIPEDIQKVVSMWVGIVGGMEGIYKAYLKNAKLSISSDNKLLIVLTEAMAAKMLRDETHKEKIKEMIADRIGKEVDIDIKCLEKEQNFEQTYPDLSQFISMEVEIEDEKEEL
ncbi:MAG: DNA polymerase III subunit gamma/tau [Clostridia bacterium]|nr:DNA polymerase III subunit gamma/tau [Clostridia bacterium]